MKHFWSGLTWAARASFGAGAALLAVLLVAGAWWLLHTEYDLLFADLKAQDAAMMTNELERLKIPYRLAEDGAAIMVEKSAVHATRLKLMGRELPLQGAVGLELFNNADFGMTEFAEKINYQRALQGELTRTILALSEIRDARVHLAFPEQGVFKQSATRPKAAVTVTMKPGQALTGAQIAGIQRLVAAAIAGMSVDDVTLVDQRGIALTRENGQADGANSQSGRLELKRETEDYLSRKAGAVLERALGPGQALASVDVSLNMDQMRVTTEDVLPGAAGVAGVVVHERETLGAPGSPTDNARASTVRQRETDYHAGKRVEQIVSQPGSIRRIQVLAVVRQALEPARREQVRALVSAAVGAAPERGDVVVVESFGETHTAAPIGPAANERPASGAAGAGAASITASDRAAASSTHGAQSAQSGQPNAAAHASVALPACIETGNVEAKPIALLAAATLLVLAARWLMRRIAGAHAPDDHIGMAESIPVQALDAAQRQDILKQLKAWMAHAVPQPATEDPGQDLHRGAFVETARSGSRPPSPSPANGTPREAR